MNLFKITVKPGKSDAILRYHPWIFSGAIQHIDGQPEEGDLVAVYDNRQQFLCLGHYGSGSIAVRVITFEKIQNIQGLAESRIEAALSLRKMLGFINNKNTNAYRLFNGEGDGWSGLIIDIYNDIAVIQCHHPGVYKLAELFGKLVYKKLSGVIQHVIVKNDFRDEKDELLIGEDTQTQVIENGHHFFVDVAAGQKTGFFLDQRDNRSFLSSYSSGKNICNLFCYSGGFSVYALKAGAMSVDSIDSSSKAMEWTNKNVELNGNYPQHSSYTKDVFDFLKQSDRRYDVMVLDPPAFAKNVSARHNAIQAYKRLNEIALNQISKGGIIFTFSCSQVVTRDLFEGAVLSASIDAKRNVRIIQRLTQPADHPVNIFHPEGIYLKGLVLYVE